MKYCLFVHDGRPAYGLIESVAGTDTITRLFRLENGQLPDEDAPTSRVEPIAFASVQTLAPVRPSKIICVGRNYADHAKELDHEVPTDVLIFSKPPSAIINPRDPVLRPKISERVDHEGELAVIIGQRCRHVADDQDVRPFIHGYTCLNDVTARDLQFKDGQWTRAKGFDTFCPIEIDPWAGVSVECRVNGEVRQQGNTTQFIFPLDRVIRYISAAMTLLPGDVIATGTPAGVGPLNAGDVVEVTCGGIGTLSNPVANE